MSPFLRKVHAYSLFQIALEIFTEAGLLYEDLKSAQVEGMPLLTSEARGGLLFPCGWVKHPDLHQLFLDVVEIKEVFPDLQNNIRRGQLPILLQLEKGKDVPDQSRLIHALNTGNQVKIHMIR